MRKIDTHKAKEDETLTIAVCDVPGAGGANHRYEINGFDARNNASFGPMDFTQHVTILFQNGPIPEVGTNGVTQEALIAIVIDRLRSFQAGPYACTENAIALEHFEIGLDALKLRTAKRVARGVEGTREA